MIPKISNAFVGFFLAIMVGVLTLTVKVVRKVFLDKHPLWVMFMGPLSYGLVQGWPFTFISFVVFCVYYNDMQSLVYVVVFFGCCVMGLILYITYVFIQEQWEKADYCPFNSPPPSPESPESPPPPQLRSPMKVEFIFPDNPPEMIRPTPVRPISPRGGGQIRPPSPTLGFFGGVTPSLRGRGTASIRGRGRGRGRSQPQEPQSSIYQYPFAERTPGYGDEWKRFDDHETQDRYLQPSPFRKLNERPY